MRDFEGYAETRRQMMTIRPDLSDNWKAYYVALYLSK